jgi:hypothetical protein
VADTKISALSSAGALTGDEVVPIVQSGGNFKLALSALLTWITTSLNAAARLVPLVGANPNGHALRIVSGVPVWFAVSEMPDTSAATDGEVVRLVGGAPAWSPTREIPTGGTNGQVLRANIDGDPVFETVGLVAPGSVVGYVYRQTGSGPYDHEWGAVRELPDPSGATEGDVLTIDGTGTPVYQAPAASGLTYRQVLSATSLS